MITTRLVLLMAMLAFTLSSASAAEVYRNERAGVQLRTPPGWHLQGPALNLKGVKSLKLEDAELRAAQREYSSRLLLVLSKHPPSFRGLNPTLKIDLKPAEGKVPMEMMASLIPLFQRSFKQLAIVQAPSEVTLGGVTGAYFQATYQLETRGKAYPASSELWILPHRGGFLVIGVSTSPGAQDSARQEILEALSSLELF